VDLTYEQLTEMAEKARPFQLFIDPDAPLFLNPANMVKAIADFACQTGQIVPEEPGEVTRAILESLALKYRLVIDELEALTDQNFRIVHIIGGGSRNDLLNQFTAEATGKLVLAGPEEATATGNILIQALASGQLNDRLEIRKTVSQSLISKNSGHTHQKYGKKSWLSLRSGWRRFTTRLVPDYLDRRRLKIIRTIIEEGCLNG